MSIGVPLVGQRTRICRRRRVVAFLIGSPTVLKRPGPRNAEQGQREKATTRGKL